MVCVLGGDLQFYSGPLPRMFKHIIGILSSSPVDCHPFRANWEKRGVCGHVQKLEAQALGCRTWGESSQWSSNYPKFPGLCQHEIVRPLEVFVLEVFVLSSQPPITHIHTFSMHRSPQEGERRVSAGTEVTY